MSIEFAIHELVAGGGTLALSPMPGRTRHYQTDWQSLLDWAPHLVVTVCSMAELERKGSGTLGSDLVAAGIGWLHWPVTDFATPEPEQEGEFPPVASAIRKTLGRGGKVLVHCYGGCGRSGMVVLRILVALGERPDAALERLRHVRPCAVETDAQRLWAIAIH